MQGARENACENEFGGHERCRRALLSEAVRGVVA